MISVITAVIIPLPTLLSNCNQDFLLYFIIIPFQPHKIDQDEFNLGSERVFNKAKPPENNTIYWESLGSVTVVNAFPMI